MNPFQFLAFLKSPEYVLRAVAADAEVDGVQRLIALFPDILAVSIPALRDRIAEKEDIDMALPGDSQKTFVPLLPQGLLAGSRRRGAACRLLVVGRRPRRHEDKTQEA